MCDATGMSVETPGRELNTRTRLTSPITYGDGKINVCGVAHRHVCIVGDYKHRVCHYRDNAISTPRRATWPTNRPGCFLPSSSGVILCVARMNAPDINSSLLTVTLVDPFNSFRRLQLWYRTATWHDLSFRWLHAAACSGSGSAATSGSVAVYASRSGAGTGTA